MDAYSLLPSLASSSKRERLPSKRSARRCLFGRPDPKETKQWLNERLEEIRETQMQRYGFDFDAETPCASGSSGFIITAVAADSVPQFYRPRTYRKDESSDSENRSPELSDSDCSMEEVRLESPPPRAKYISTPRKQAKLTSYMHVQQRKRLQRSAKTEDICGPKSPSDVVVPRHLKAASQ